MMNSKATIAALLTIVCLMAATTTYFTTPERSAEKPATQRNSISTEDLRRLMHLR